MTVEDRGQAKPLLPHRPEGIDDLSRGHPVPGRGLQRVGAGEDVANSHGALIVLRACQQSAALGWERGAKMINHLLPLIRREKQCRWRGALSILLTGDQLILL